MNSRCWVTPDRYYHLRLQSDLFGQLSVVKSWGGRHNHLGGCESVPIKKESDAIEIFDEVEKQRLKRGYQPLISH